MKKIFFLTGILLSFMQTHAQLKPIAKHIAEMPARFFVDEKLFTLKAASVSALKSDNMAPPKYDLVNADKDVLIKIAEDKNEALQLEIPIDGKMVTLLLRKNKISDEQTIFSTGDGGKQKNVLYEPGAYYGGIIKDDINSLVGISFFKNTVMGMISTKKGNYVIGKKNLADFTTNEYIIYNEKDFISKNLPKCLTQDTLESFLVNPTTDKPAATKCLKVYIQADYAIYNMLGGDLDPNAITNVNNYVTAIFNNVAILFQNEQIPMTISQIWVYNYPDPFILDDWNTVPNILDDFQSYMAPGYNGDMALLFSGRLSPVGKASGFGMLCDPNLGKRSAAITGFYYGVDQYPIFSYKVWMVAHEIGHLLNSRHTHACAWNGNHTAIDGCACPENAEGFGCALGPIPPPNGGTIMSYCAGVEQRPINCGPPSPPTDPQLPGIDFTLGFGQQPGDRIRTYLANAPCLYLCCPYSVVISGTYTAALTEAHILITSDATLGASIPGNATVILDVGPSDGAIELNPGFETVLGCLVIAQALDGCGPQIPSFADGGISSKNAYSLISSKSSTDRQYEIVGKATDQIKVYPNPVTDKLHVICPESTKKITLLDVVGTPICDKYTNGASEIELDLRNIPGGIYILRIDDKTIIKIIKK